MASPIEEIKSRLDLVGFLRGYLDLKPAGRNLKASCPFHKERTPSFMVSPERQIWHCFGCNEGGDIFKFLMKYENLEFYEALQVLAEKAGIELRRVSPADQREFGVLYDISRISMEFYQKNLEASEVGRGYLQKRGVVSESIENFGIGFASQSFEDLTLHLINVGFDVKDLVRSGMTVRSEKGKYFDRFRGRIMFPLFNNFGKPVGFSGRILPNYETEETAKYLNSPETPIFSKSKILYGLVQGKEAIRDAGFTLIVEGMMDVIASHQDGVKNTIGISGTALTIDQLRVLHRHTNKLVLNLDNDAAGKQATERSIDLGLENDFEVRVLDLGGIAAGKGLQIKDAADLVLLKPGLLKDLAGQSVGGMEYYCREFLKDGDISDRKQGIRMALQKVRKISSAIERDHWLKQVADRTGIRESSLREEMEKLGTTGPEAVKKVDIPVDLRDIKLSRRELIAERLLGCFSGDSASKERVEKVKEFLPQKYLEVYYCLAEGKQPESEDFASLANLINLRSGLGETDAAGISREEEMEELGRNLEMEFWMEKRDSLKKLIQASGGDPDEKTLGYIKDFQDITAKIEALRAKKILYNG
ncbi:MAG: DNA primase [Patescibacteria group bacterium]|nr:DNA primase [Patescibacteria group bacterium]